jgi:rhamnosyl/mannosyltransferase
MEALPVPRDGARHSVVTPGRPGGWATAGDDPGTARTGSLRILVITSEAPPVVSGISRCVDRLTVGLRERGHRVDVLSSAEIPRLVLGEWRLSSLALRWPEVARRLREYDVINLHGPVPTMSDAFLVLSRFLTRACRPIVYTHHSALEIRGVERACSWYNRIHRLLSARAALTLTTSRYYAEVLQIADAPPVRVVPWGVDIRPERRRPRRGLEPLRVLFVGQMRPYKGVECLLPAVAKQRQIELTLVGGGSNLRDYQLQAAQLGCDNVRFLGRLSDPDLIAEYDRNDVVVLPSVTRAEAFGLTVLEGMAAGCVPVVSDLPGVRDLVSRTGIVVPPWDIPALRAALNGLAADRTRLDYLARAARRRAEGLGWDACVDCYEDALTDAVRMARRPPPRKPARTANGHAVPRPGVPTRPFRADPVNGNGNGNGHGNGNGAVRTGPVAAPGPVRR